MQDFNESRCAEMIDAAAARTKGEEFPLEMKAMLVSMLRLDIVRLNPGAFSQNTEESQQLKETFALTMMTAFPELYEGEGKIVLHRIENSLIADMNDLVRNERG